MPQMAPLWWTSLFLISFLTYTVTIVYFLFNINFTKQYNKIKTMKQMNWKW